MEEVREFDPAKDDPLKNPELAQHKQAAGDGSPFPRFDSQPQPQIINKPHAYDQGLQTQAAMEYSGSQEKLFNKRVAIHRATDGAYH